jgi:hypothetical protein
MPSQIITIVKVAGEAGRFLSDRFSRWLGERNAPNPNEFDPAQWPATTRIEIDRIVDHLRAHRHLPPVVYHSEHVDLWSGFDLFISLDMAERCPSVMGDRYEVYSPTIDDPQAWGRKVDETFARLAGTHQQETCWSLWRLKECVFAWGKIVPNSTIFVVRQIVAGLVTDEELTASLEEVPDWLER